MTEEQGFHPYEFAVFTAQLEIEVKQADSISVSSTGDRLVLISAGSVISYEPYGTGIRRRVNYSGHQMMLQQASHVTFSSGEQAVAVEAEGAGRTFRAAMLFPSGLLRGYHQSEQTPELKERITSEYCQPGRNDTESHNCQVAEAAYERE
nr:ComGF family competence protein [Alkalicoccus luteus]